MGKWFLLLTVFIMGELLVCFGLMAQQNQCSPYLVQTFDSPGRFALLFAGCIFVVCVLHALVGPARRWSQRLRQVRPTGAAWPTPPAPETSLAPRLRHEHESLSRPLAVDDRPGR